MIPAVATATSVSMEFRSARNGFVVLPMLIGLGMLLIALDWLLAISGRLFGWLFGSVGPPGLIPPLHDSPPASTNVEAEIDINFDPADRETPPLV